MLTSTPRKKYVKKFWNKFAFYDFCYARLFCVIYIYLGDGGHTSWQCVVYKSAIAEVKRLGEFRVGLFVSSMI